MYKYLLIFTQIYSEIFSWAILVNLVSQQINRNLSAILHFPLYCTLPLMLGNQQINREMTHTLGQIWVLILGQRYSGWEINRSTGICALWHISPLTTSISNQHINGEFYSLWVNFELYSGSVMAILVNQHINGNMRAIPYFLFFW